MLLIKRLQHECSSMSSVVRFARIPACGRNAASHCTISSHALATALCLFASLLMGLSLATQWPHSGHTRATHGPLYSIEVFGTRLCSLGFIIYGFISSIFGMCENLSKTQWPMCGHCVATVWPLCGQCVATAWPTRASGRALPKNQCE